MTTPARCPRESLGYLCDRPRGHGMVHRDPNGQWWLLVPRTVRETMGIEPMSGYLLVHDDLLLAHTDADDRAQHLSEFALLLDAPLLINGGGTRYDLHHLCGSAQRIEPNLATAVQTAHEHRCRPGEYPEGG